MASPSSMEYYMRLLQADYSLGLSTRTKARTGEVIWDDQLALRKIHLSHYPRVKVDSLAKIFARKDDKMNEL